VGAIPKGKIIEESDLTFKRLNGISPKFIWGCGRKEEGLLFDY